MKVLFIASTKKREQDLAEAFGKGVTRFIDDFEWTTKRVETMDRFGDFDAVCMVGVKSAKFFHHCLNIGVVPIMFDKGYTRTKPAGSRVWAYWRISIGAHQPTAYLMQDKMPADRFDGLNLRRTDWNKRGSKILLAGSSAKYHQFVRAEHPTAWAKAVVKEVRRKIDKPIIYRPKPSWREAQHIPRTEFNQNKSKLLPILQHSHCVITHGSNISFEAALNGVPSIVLGGGIGAAISSRSLDDICNPYRAPDREVTRWLRNLAYWQWTEDEMANGDAWKFLRPRLERFIDAN